METEERLNKELEDILTKIDRVSRELKALRGHQAESAKGKPRASFITGRQRMIEADEVAKQLDTLRQREREIRTKLHSDNSQP